MPSNPLLAKALACWKSAEEAEREQLAREKEDMGFYAGGDLQWDPKVIEIRKGRQGDGTIGNPTIPARPYVSVNKVRQPVRQLLNQERNAHMGAELIPADDFGAGVPEDVKAEIELREGLYRRMQRQPEAKAATSWTFDRVAQCGRGFWRLGVRYVSDRSFDKEIVRERIYNQSSVKMDPSSVEPDGSDARWCLIASDMSEEGYKAEFPESNVASMLSADEFTGLMSECPGWFSNADGQKMVRVVEYFYTTLEEKTLCWFNGGAFWKEQLPTGVKAEGPPDPLTGKPSRPRVVQVPTIKWAKLNGAEVLDEEEWPGRYIPVVKELGEELQPFDNDRRSEGLVRQAIGSQRGFNFMISELIFAIGQSTKAPYLSTREQIEGFEKMWEGAATLPMPYLLYNEVSQNGTPLGPPQPTDRNIPIQHIAFGINTFAQGIHDTTGVPEASLGNIDPSIKSGKAIIALQQQAQQATSNYMDNHARSMMHDARIWNDLAYPVYSNRPGRQVEIVNGQNETETRAIGQSQDQSIKAATLTDRNFNIVVKVGKNFDTRNEEGAQALSETLGANPGLLAAYLDLWFGMQTWPGADIAKERAKLMLPPNIQQAEAQKGQNPQAELQQVKGQLDQQGKLTEALTARVKEQQVQIESDTVKQAGETSRLHLELASKERIAAINAHATLIAAELKVNAAAGTEMLKAEVQRILAALEDQHEILMANQGHAQDAAMQDQQHQQATAQTDQQAGIDAQQQDTAHQQGMESQQQAADLAPEPASGE